MDISPVTAALLASLASGAPPLKILAYPKYPAREMRPASNLDGSVTLTLAKWGWEYKHRGPRPAIMPHIVPLAIMEAFNATLPDGIRVVQVTDEGKYIKLKVAPEFRVERMAQLCTTTKNPPL